MEKICIIKLGALGDVVRTTPVLEAIKQKYPDSEITWITKPEAVEILEGNQNIDEILTIPIENFEEFDILYNFDIEDDATALASKINASKKYGFYLDNGFPAAFSPGAEYYLNTVFDDNLKKSNKKTYQEMMFDLAELKYEKQKIQLNLTEESKEIVKEFIKSHSIKGKVIGINIGSSQRWPSKAWAMEKIKQAIIEFDKLGYSIILLGGGNEKQAMNELYGELKNNTKIYISDTANSLKDFFAIVSICDKVLTADSLAMHVALAFEKPTVALFFVTSPAEIEGYNSLTKIISPMLQDFFPERSDEYDGDLVNSISVEEVVKAIEK